MTNKCKAYKKRKIELIDIVYFNIIAALVALYALHAAQDKPNKIVMGLIAVQAATLITEIVTRKLGFRGER